MFQPEGPAYENPSADKFGPPSDPTISQPDRKRRRRLARLVFTVVVLAAAYWLKTNVPGHRWFTMFSVIIALGSSVLDYALRRHDDREGGDDPYSPPISITGSSGQGGPGNDRGAAGTELAAERQRSGGR
jgi:hypothetical protein